ncbi:MAG TPA: Rid family hydrolase [Burkholderiaceae bacterium]
MFKLFNPDTMFKPTAGYSQLVEIIDGKIVYIAGQVPLDKAGNLVGKDDFRAQLQHDMSIPRVLRPARSSW